MNVGAPQGVTHASLQDRLPSGFSPVIVDFEVITMALFIFMGM
jgi:hypothetical protein